MKTIEQVIEQIQAGTAQVIPLDDLKKKLAKGKPLIVKLGADPTAADLHLGHAVVLSKLRQFQDLGHDVIFLIGDYTARIGDPTGKSKTRPPLTTEQILENTKTYFDQVSKILDRSRLQVRYNSEWLDTLTSKEMLQLCAQVTVAGLIEREDFAKRLAEKQPIGFHELLYPLLQGYDSVALAADIELGGTDQTFNLLMGRHLQQQYGREPQVVLTMPLLEGLDGVHKMSKSLGNAIGLNESSDQAYGKLMSISDQLMFRYARLLLHATEKQVNDWMSAIVQSHLHPMDLKKKIAHDIVSRFWSVHEAQKAQEIFEALFQKQDYSKAKEVTIGCMNQPIWIVELLKQLGSVTSSSQAKQLIESKAVHVDDVTITDFKATLVPVSGMIVKVGKHRIYKLS